MNFCPHCGSPFLPEDRFCQDCGFDTSTIMTAGPVPVIPSVPPATEPELSPDIPQAAIQPTPSFEQTNTLHDKLTESDEKKKGKKVWLYIVLVVIAVCALAIAGWIGLKKYRSSQTSVVATSDVVKPGTNNSAVDSSLSNDKGAEHPEQVSPVQSKTVIKKESSNEQKAIRQKANVQTKTSKQSETKAQTNVETTVKETRNDYLAKVILKVGKREDPKNKNPKNPVKLSIHKPTMIIRITTYHYNDGVGTQSAGTITIIDRKGNVIGSFKANGQAGKTGAPNSIWITEPRIVLQKGTYNIWDSEMSTWSKTLTGQGFIVVEGYVTE